MQIVTGALGKVTEGVVKGTGELGNNWTSGDNPNYGNIMIGHNTEKSPVDLWRLAVIQTPVKDQ